jgi:protein phosphatase 1 regulatory subunit 7
MKPSFIVILALITKLTVSQNVRIPDVKFKQRIISLGYDLNDDQQIQVDEAQKVTKLYVNDLEIVNLEGINSFVNLEEFGCYNNKITKLDVSKLKKLKYLYAFGNRISELNLTGLTKLEHIYLQDNYFIDGLDVTKFKQLKELNISKNRFKKLDVTGLDSLQKIEAESNNIATVALTKAPLLQSVNLKNNPISTGTIDIRGLTNLEFFDFEGCNLLFINFSGTFKLKKYYW